MSAWSKNELSKIAEADDLHIAPLRDDGRTYGTPTWIWSVAVDGAMCGPTMALSRAGIRPLCDRKLDASPPPA
jgi:hypothetical protein